MSWPRRPSNRVGTIGGSTRSSGRDELRLDERHRRPLVPRLDLAVRRKRSHSPPGRPARPVHDRHLARLQDDIGSAADGRRGLVHSDLHVQHLLVGHDRPDDDGWRNRRGRSRKGPGEDNGNGDNDRSSGRGLRGDGQDHGEQARDKSPYIGANGIDEPNNSGAGGHAESGIGLTGLLDFGDAFIGSAAWDVALLRHYFGADAADAVATVLDDTGRLASDGALLAIAVAAYKLAKQPDRPGALDALARAMEP